MAKKAVFTCLVWFLGCGTSLFAGVASQAHGQEVICAPIAIARPGVSIGQLGITQIKGPLGRVLAGFPGPSGAPNAAENPEIAVGDVNGDGTDEIVVLTAAAGPLLPPRHQINIRDMSGKLLSNFAGPSAAPNAAEKPEIAIGGFEDADGDGLLDAWEQNGIDYDGDGTIDFDLPALGANPDQRDIFVEVDYFDCTVARSTCTPGDSHNHRPPAIVFNLAIAAFAGAPVVNPDGSTGINLHVQVDERLAHRPTCGLNGSCFGPIKAAHFGTTIERGSVDAAKLLAAKRMVYHYNLWGHQQAVGSFVSGLADLSGNNFLVSLGGWPGLTLNDQAGTFIHELGHNLGLRHGGGDDINCKPNYLSVMSYALQTSGLIPGNVFDYSRQVLPGSGSLGENALDEAIGIQNDPGFRTIYGPPVNLNNIDDNGDGDITDDWLTGPGFGTSS